MRAGRRFLYWGLFFLSVGAVMLAAQLHLVDEAAIVQALRLWPVAVIAIGIAIVVRSTRASLFAWAVAATLPGLLLGGTIASGPGLSVDCTDRSRPVLTSATGTIADAGTIDASAACGSLDVVTAPGSAWRLDTADRGRATARVSSSSTDVTVDAGTTGSFSAGRSSPTTWRLTVPTAPLQRLRLAVSLGDGTFDLAGLRVGDLSLVGNGTQLHVDLSEASVTRVSTVVHVGGVSLILPRGDLTGTLEITVGELRVCLPSDVGLHIRRTSEFGTVRYQGFEQRAPEWQSPGYEQAPMRADMTVTPSLGDVEFDPIGGCR
ncbi:MAG TPA: DUF5668 domain-containing protein [Candidatus Dormibacteraeota bacterium]|nr:DUF5668 domain-containing protein [Candidatus Dormibacteraeota bacterium]